MESTEFGKALFLALERISERPKLFEFYTASDLWTDEHTSKQMLSFHLNEEVDLSSRNTRFIDKSVAWLVSHLGIVSGTRIVDFGCGPGLYTFRLAERGADVTGIDFSTRSIEYAKNQASGSSLDINYIHQNYLDFDTTDRFDLILMIMCDYCALSPTQRKTMLMKFGSILNTGGHVVLDVHSMVAFEKYAKPSRYAMNLQNGFWSSEPYHGFLNTFKYQNEKVTLDKYTIVERTKTRVIYNWLQYFSVESLKEEFRDAGLTIAEIRSDVAGTPYDAGANEFAVIAKR